MLWLIALPHLAAFFSFDCLHHRQALSIGDTNVTDEGLAFLTAAAWDLRSIDVKRCLQCTAVAIATLIIHFCAKHCVAPVQTNRGDGSDAHTLTHSLTPSLTPSHNPSPSLAHSLTRASFLCFGSPLFPKQKQGPKIKIFVYKLVDSDFQVEKIEFNKDQ